MSLKHEPDKHEPDKPATRPICADHGPSTSTSTGGRRTADGADGPARCRAAGEVAQLAGVGLPVRSAAPDDDLDAVVAPSRDVPDMRRNQASPADIGDLSEAGAAGLQTLRSMYAYHRAVLEHGGFSAKQARVQLEDWRVQLRIRGVGIGLTPLVDELSRKKRITVTRPYVYILDDETNA